MLKTTTPRKPYCTDESWTGRAYCKHCAIRNTVLFSVLSEAELDAVLKDVDNGRFEAGSELFAQNAEAGYVYTVRDGCVKIVHRLEDGVTRIVRMHYRGDAIGLEALLGEPYRHSAVVLQKADICRIPAAAVHALKTNNAGIYDQLLVRWQQSLDEAETVITELNTGHAESRLARLLLKFDAHSERHCVPHLLREDIAAIIGVSTETASRLMADFRRRNLIEEKDKRIMQCNPEALRALA
jgi:CRP-like cAMP-binding protein